MRLGRLLNGFESAPEVYGTQTIVDEPDPTNSRPPKDPPSEGPEPVERDEDGDEDDSGAQTLKALG